MGSLRSRCVRTGGYMSAFAKEFYTNKSKTSLFYSNRFENNKIHDIDKVDFLAFLEKSLDRASFSRIFKQAIRGSIETLESNKSFHHFCVHSKILQNFSRYRSIEIFFNK